MKTKQSITTLQNGRVVAYFYSIIHKPIVLVLFCIISFEVSILQAQDNSAVELQKGLNALNQNKYTDAFYW